MDAQDSVMGRHTGERVLNVGRLYGWPLNIFVVKETVGTNGVGPVAAGTRDTGCGLGAQLLRQANGASIASGVSQIKTFIFRGVPALFFY